MSNKKGPWQLASADGGMSSMTRVIASFPATGLTTEEMGLRFAHVSGGIALCRAAGLTSRWQSVALLGGGHPSWIAAMTALGVVVAEPRYLDALATLSQVGASCACARQGLGVCGGVR